MTALMVKRMGLFGGPLLGLLCYRLLPTQYSSGPASGWSSRRRGGPPSP